MTPRMCRWACRLCSATGTSRTPIRAWEWHWKNTHAIGLVVSTNPWPKPWTRPGTTTDTAVSVRPAHLTPIRSIYHGTR